MSILNILRSHFNKIKNNNINYLFKIDKNRFNNFSILFNKNILIDFSKNIINKYTINLLLDLFNKFNSLNLLNKSNNLNYKDFFIIDKLFIKNINNVYNNKIINNNFIKNIVNIGNIKYKYEFDLILESLKNYKNNNYKFYYFYNLDINNLNLIKNFDFESTIFIISCDINYKNLELIEIINFIIKKINKNKINDYFDSNLIIVSSNIEFFSKMSIFTKNIINLDNKLNLNIYTIYYISMILIIYLGNLNFNNLINGIFDINNNFINEKNIYKNIPIILSLIDIWNFIFFKIEEKILFVNYNLNKFIDYYINLYISYKINNINYNIIGSSDIYIQNFLYDFFINKNNNYEFITVANNENFLFTNNNDDIISNFIYKSKILSFINNKDIINNFLFKDNKLYIKNKFINKISVNNFIFLNKLNPYNLGILIYIYKYRVFIKKILLSNIFRKEFKFNNYYLFKNILNIKSEKQEVNYDDSTNKLINFYKKNRYL